MFLRTGGTILVQRKAVVLVVFLVIIMLETAVLPNGAGMIDAVRSDSPSRSIGKVIDLNTTTENPHAEHRIRIGRVSGKYVDMFQFMDLNGDSFVDMVFRQINGTLTSNEDRTHILAALGPLDANATYALSDLPRWTLPFRVRSLIVCDHNGDGLADLIVSKKQYKGNDMLRNSSFIGFDGISGSGPVFPWQGPSFTVWFDPAENRTAENLSLQDIDGDGTKDLLLQTRTWYRKRPQDFWALPTNEYLIKNGLRSLSGRLSRTEIGSELIAERQDSSVYGQYYLDHPLSSGNILGNDDLEIVSFERNFRPSGSTSLRGAVLVVGPLDLSKPRHLVRGNVSTAVIGVVYDGSTTRNSIGAMVGDIDDDGYGDIMVTMQSIQANLPNQFILVFKGNQTLPAVWDISLTPPSTTIEGFNPLLLDHDGDGSDDLMVGYYKETVLSRSSCGVLRLGLNISDLQFPVAASDLNSVSVMGARANDEIGRTLSSLDLDGDGRKDLLALTGGQSMYIDLYVLMGLKLSGPKVLEIRGMPFTCERGEQLTIEVFARDPQNYPRYLQLTLEITTGSGTWIAPQVTKTVQNFSYETPYNGSTLITFTIPLDIETGPMDIMVKAVNTFGLVSEPYVLYSVSTILNRFPSFTEASLSPSELFRGDVLQVQGTVVDPDDQADLEGRVLLKVGPGWDHVADLTIQSSGQFTGQFIVPSDMPFGPNMLRMDVQDDNGATNLSRDLDFDVLPMRLECSLNVTDRSILRGEDLSIEVNAQSDLGPISLDLELINGSRKIGLLVSVPTGLSIINMTVPLNFTLGDHSLEMSASDGFWTDTSILDGPLVVLNNDPSIDGPLQVMLKGLSGEIDLRDKGRDKEDGTDLFWSLKGPIDSGLSAYFRDPSGLLFVDMTDNMTRSLTVSVSDKDGGITTAVISVGSSWNAPPLDVTIKAIGPNDEPIEGANITLLVRGTVIAFGPTSSEGSVDMEVPRAGTYDIRIEPPALSSYVEKVRSGYVPYEGELTIEAQTLLYWFELVYKELGSIKYSTLSVTVKDEKDLPVEGANVTLRGPVNLTMRTDGAGTVLFKDLPSGTYTVQASIGKRASLEIFVVVPPGKFITTDLVVEMEEEGAKDEDFPYLILIIGSLFVGLLIGLLFLYLMGTFKRRDTGPYREE